MSVLHLRVCVISLLLAFYGVTTAAADEVQAVPQAPCYANTTMWYCVENDLQGTGADVFYIPSTWEFDWTTADGRVSHYADVWNPAHRKHMNIEQRKVAGYMAQGNNFYSPFYRHITLETWATLNEDTISRRVQLAMTDVKQAFDHFLSRRDPTRPLVIAGFSQGAKAVVELLKYMNSDTYRHLVAAYVLGYKVTPEDTLQSRHIKAARDSADIGVTICYNSVKDVRYVKPVVSEPNTMCINPVNWRTDATPALLNDSITVTVSPEHHVLVLTGYSGSEYRPILNFINVGDVHGCEPWLYSECLRWNIALRISAWKKTNRYLTDDGRQP